MVYSDIFIAKAVQFTVVDEVPSSISDLMMSKREYEKKRREEQEAAAHVFQDFINTFQDSSPAPTKTFVKSGVLYSESSQENKEVRQLYNPKPVIRHNNVNTIKSAIECARILKENNLEKSKKQEKPKSNLDLLKEELKLRHTERGERDRLKEELDLSTPALSYFEGGDPNSTNLFVANLSSKITENHLMLEFGAYGPLASVKIMWPRGDEKLRNSNCGFVAFMSRRDAERALRENNNRDDMRVGWGKSVELPAHPIYIPTDLLKLYLPPPPSGLPFNAQPPSAADCKKPADDGQPVDDLLRDCVVKVTIPLNKKILMLVHRMVEFVVREGPMFEAFIMNRELGNSEFNFLFDYQSPVHVYYRWKLFSILKGDNKKNWSMKPFRMFKGGSIWLPPMAPNYTEGMPEQLIGSKEKSVDSTKLSDSQCGRLIALIRNLSMNRSKIAETMVFCLNHDGAIDDSIGIIVDSMKNADTHPLKKIARLYLLSDVLFNSKKMATNIEESSCDLLEVFKVFHSSLVKMKTACDKDNFKSRVLRVLHHWDVCRIVSVGFVRKAESLFLNNFESTEIFDDDNSSIDEPLDGANLLKRSLKNEIGPDVVTPINPKEKKESSKRPMTEYFIPSKWDTVDPQEVEAQAMSTHKMYYMELENQLNRARVDKKEKCESQVEVKSFSEGKKWSAGKEKQKKSKDKESRSGSGSKGKDNKESRKQYRSRRK